MYKKITGVAQCGPLSKIASSWMICTICIVVINSLYVLTLVYDVDCVGFREFQEILGFRGFRGFRGLNGRLRVVDGVDCVYGVSIWVNVNDGNDVGTDRAICRKFSLKAKTGMFGKEHSISTYLFYVFRNCLPSPCTCRTSEAPMVLGLQSP